MTNLFAELELKLLNFETKIEEKIGKVKNVLKVQIKLFDEKFNIGHLAENYSNELNKNRNDLLDKVSVNTRLEIDQANEAIREGDESSVLALMKKRREFVFKPSLFKSIRICIWKLVISEFKFDKKFSSVQLNKYKNILQISQYIIRKVAIKPMTTN